MDISHFLAQVFGLYFVLGGAALLLHPFATQEIMEKWSTDRSTVFFGGLIALLLGIPLVLIHNIWDGTWRIVVTIIVWLVLTKGLVRAFAPDVVVDWTVLLASRPRVMRWLLIIMVAIGFYLLYVGFKLGT